MPELEDEVADIISKAHRGLNLSTSIVAEMAGVELKDVRAARSEHASPATIEAIAPCLKLRPEPLIDMLADRYCPQQSPLDGLTRIDTPAPMQTYPEMRVNAYLVHHPDKKEAILFDTGTSLQAIKAVMEKAALQLTNLFVTHTHWDHIDIVDDLLECYPNLKIHGPALPTQPKQTILRGSESFQISGLKIDVFETKGHAHDGLSYTVEGLELPVAIVGDAVFAGSVGGMAAENYQHGLEAIREHILSLPSETIIAPGHAGLSNVGYERSHNPFF